MFGGLFRIVWDSQYKRPLINYILRRFVIHDRRVIFGKINDCVLDSLGKNQKDEEIFLKIRKLMNPYPRNNQMDIRSQYRTRELLNLIPFKINSYLDYGCGDGSITRQLGSALDVNSKNIFGVDLVDTPGINYVKNVKEINPDSFDLVTAFVSLHHIENGKKIIGEIHRILKPGGLLIIREHDFNGDFRLNAYLDLIHMFVDVRFDRCKIINYKSAYDWHKLLCGKFKMSTFDYCAGYNPQRLYYAVYIKI
jgi:ubiquinone/menaquinone biosynthesis C-methylase UbiE